MQFPEVFCSELPGYKGAPIHIEIKVMQPKFLKRRTVPFALREDMAKELDRLEQQGNLEPTQYSNWATPRIMVRKKHGMLQLRSNYHSTVNKAFKGNMHPSLTITELFATFGTSKVFTKLDLPQAYLRLVLDNESAEALTVNNLKGLYKVCRLPFGISVAPGLFQRVVDSLLTGIPGVVVYLDDFVIPGSTVAEHDRLGAMIKHLQETQVNGDKCKVCRTKIEYLGCRINWSGIHTSKDKVTTIKNAPSPKNKQELLAFLGLVNFYSRFLEGKLKLHHLLNQDKKRASAKEHESAFHNARKLYMWDMTQNVH